MEKLAKANTWFHYDHPEHGKMEVSAHVDEKGQAKIKGVGTPGDVHVHPKKDAGLKDEHIKAMSDRASKLGPGDHKMKKSEVEMAVAILDKVKEVAERQGLLKSTNSAHVVEPGERVENSPDESETDMPDIDDAEEKKRKKKENETEDAEDANDGDMEPDSDLEDTKDKDIISTKKTELPLASFLKKMENKRSRGE